MMAEGARNICFGCVWQTTWFGLILCAATAWAWLGALLALALLALLLLVLWPGRFARDAALMAEAAWLGACFDGALAASGLIVYAPHGGLFAPPWIIAMWVWLAAGLLHPLALLQSRLWLAACVGLLGGPLAYYAGIRFSAIAIADFATTGLIIAAGYALATGWLAWRARRPGLPGWRCWEQPSCAAQEISHAD